MTKDCVQSSDKAAIYDKTGRAIAVGDVLKVFHFTAALRRKKHYMYKQVVEKTAIGGDPYFKIDHLDLSGATYLRAANGEHLPHYEIIQGLDHNVEDRQRHSTTVAP